MIKSANKTNLFEVILFLNIVSIYCFETMPILNILSKILLLVLIYLGIVNFTVKKQMKFNVNVNIILTGLFGIYCFVLKEHLEGDWSRLSGLNIQTAFSVFLALCIFFIVYYNVDTIEKRERVLTWITLSGVLLSIIVLCIVRSQIIYGLHSAGMLESLASFGFHSNHLGVCWAFSFLIGIYLYTKKKTYRYLIYTIVNLLFLILTGSRKAFLYLVVGLATYYFFSKNSSRINRLLRIVSWFLFAVFLVIVSPSLQNLIGERVLNLIDVLRGGTGNDSTITRLHMIQYGISLIEDNPLFGNGLNYFSISYGMVYGNEVYSHNNYIDITVSGGLVMLFLYYSRFVVVLNRLYCIVFQEKEAALFFALLLAMLFADVAAVTYYYRIYYIIFALASSCAYCNTRMGIPNRVKSQHTIT